MTEEMFFDLCQANSELRMERDQHGNIIVMSLTRTSTGNYTSELNYEITPWNRQTQLGYVFDSSTGFTLLNSAMGSPDVSWVAKNRWENLPKKEQDKFAHICPDFVIEVHCETDRLSTLKANMEEYCTNGCRLGWLIDRKGKAVYIYRAGGTMEIIKGDSVKISGENVLPGLVLETDF